MFVILDQPHSCCMVVHVRNTVLTHWGRLTHICFDKIITIGSDNGLSPSWTAPSHYLNQCWYILIGPLGINFSEIVLGIQTFPFTKIHLKVSSAKWRPFCLGLSVLNNSCWSVGFGQFMLVVIGNTWWRHQMETFSALLAICAGNSPVPVNSPHKGQWRGALMFSLICVWINGLVNNHEAGDLRRYCVHCDVTVMVTFHMTSFILLW